MKKTFKSALASILALVLVSLTLISLVSCAGSVKKEGLWENAVYLRDRKFGNGSATIFVEVVADGQSVTFTVKTDKKTVGEALLEYDLIAGEVGDYGLYVTEVNGITADFGVDGSYWSFCQDGEMMMVGVDSAEVTDGAHYQLVYSK